MIMTTPAQTKSTNDTPSKRLTKTDLNQLAQTQYGDKAYCEHVRSGQRGWYLHSGDEPVFLGVNITDAFHALQTQNGSTTPDSTSLEATVTSTTISSPKIATIEEIATISSTQPANTELPPPQETAIPTVSADVARSPLSSQQMLEILMEKFPHTFFKDPQKIRPIQKYIHKKIRQALNYEYTKEEVSAALAIYTQATDYCKQLILGGSRVDLEGNPCGEVSPKHIEDAKARITGEKPMRPAKNKKRQLTPRVQASIGSPPIEELVTGKMELSVKIDTVPIDSRTVRNGWQEFTIEANGQIIKVTVRPKTWNKLQKAASEYPAWIAHLKGKMGERIKGGFELDQPSIQIFEKQPKGTKVEPETTAIDNDDS
jgi:ProP effector